MNSEDFRRNPSTRKWSTSYAMRVGSALINLRRFVLMFRGDDKPIIDALELLRGYWKDLHVPYEERDQALEDLAKAKAELAEQRVKNADLREELIKSERLTEHYKKSRLFWVKLHKERGARMLAMRSAYWKLYERLHGHPHPMRANFGKTRSWSGGPANLQNMPRVAQQPTFRCNHWPLATSNMLGRRTTCEHGCHTVPLERWHNGTHQAPGLTNNQNYSRG